MNWKVTVAALVCSACVVAHTQAQGVTDKEIVLGLITDLSGPVAQYGKASRSGMQLKIDEINAQGGVNGRKLRPIVEDNGYNPKRASLAAQKLLSDDKVFAVVGHLGTATNMAALPLLIENKVFNVLPRGASKEFYDPLSPYKVGLASSYRSMTMASLGFLFNKKSYKKVGVLYQDDDFGQDAAAGVESLLKSMNKPLAEKVSYKPGATDFSSHIAKLKAADCYLEVLGTTLRELVSAAIPGAATRITDWRMH